ncbi:unnamed protein product [Trifolium pratense]|uniref:Uncharacterized protein n=1 Tax=Trifolium pratense TaxID=57577 RepID=A0ACB0ICL7_TRIPR|nr:unnamed protein product [Trifolium pratense]
MFSSDVPFQPTVQAKTEKLGPIIFCDELVPVVLSVLTISKHMHYGFRNEADWPQLPVLPSYGRGRDVPAGRYSSLIFGTHLTDVIITGNNGTIDGQGSVWWEKFKKGEMKLTRPYMIELMYSDQIQISNLNLINSPYWFVHPIYSRFD